MVVLALVVSVTIPIVRKKMEKVSYAQYWMGYNATQNIAKNVSLASFEVSDSSNCDVKLDGYCWSIFLANIPGTRAECNDNKTEWGLNYCFKYDYDADYWVGALKKCGGPQNLPSMQQLADLASDLYGQEGMDVYGKNSGLTVTNNKLIDTLLSKKVSSSFNRSFFEIYMLSNEEYVAGGVLCRFFSPSATDGNKSDYCYREDSINLSMCKGDVAPEPINICEIIKDKFNTSDYDCTLENADDSSDFTKPHITFSNGLRLFMGSDFEELFSDAESENDKAGFKIYIDVNGSKGKGILWEDVFPFYVLKSGKVLAGYPNDAKVGGNNSEYLSVNIMYDYFSDASRTVKFLDLGVDFKTAVCEAGIITSAAYCGDVAINNICKNLESDCRIKVKTPIKIF